MQEVLGSSQVNFMKPTGQEGHNSGATTGSQASAPSACFGKQETQDFSRLASNEHQPYHKQQTNGDYIVHQPTGAFNEMGVSTKTAGFGGANMHDFR